MPKTRVFISFDFDHDEDLRNLLVGQSKHPDSPFELADWSVKERLAGDWEEKVKVRIKQVDQVIVLCGEKTHTARGVNKELEFAQELRKPYFLIYGRSNKSCMKPSSARKTDKVYNWTWPNLKKLILGDR